MTDISSMVALLLCFHNSATSRRRCLLSLSNSKYCRSPENISHRGQRSNKSNWEEDFKKSKGAFCVTVIPCQYKRHILRRWKSRASQTISQPASVKFDANIGNQGVSLWVMYRPIVGNVPGRGGGWRG